MAEYIEREAAIILVKKQSQREVNSAYLRIMRELEA